MMKLPAILKANDTSGMIDAAERAIDKAQISIERLTAEREAALAGSDDIDAVRKIDAAIADERGAIAALNDRLAILETRRAEELRIYRERKHWRAVKRFEAALPNRLRAAAGLEDAVKAVAVACPEFEASCNAAEQAWPPETLMWGVRHIRPDRAGLCCDNVFHLSVWSAAAPTAFLSLSRASLLHARPLLTSAPLDLSRTNWRTTNSCWPTCASSPA